MKRSKKISINEDVGKEEKKRYLKNKLKIKRGKKVNIK